MADITIEYLPPKDDPTFDQKLQALVDLLRTYISSHDTDIDTLQTTTWTEVSSFSNSWVNYGAPYFNAAYTKVNGWVYLRGQIKDGTDLAKCFTLPSGYRPSSNVMLTSNAPGPVSVRFLIESDGDCIPGSGGAINTRVALDGLSFYVG
jgi:hypothetical protein